VLWRGVWRPAVGEVVGAGARAAALAEYRRTFPRTPDGALVIRIAVGGSGPAVVRKRSLLGRWTRWVTLGETVGFAVPAVVGAWTAGVSPFVGVPALLAAGAVEGTVLGAAQAHVLRQAIPGLPVRRWIGVTGVAAVFAYLMGLLPSTLATGWPTPAAVALGSAAGVALLLSIGVAQWTVLRAHVARSASWIAVTAAGWLAGLAVFLVVAMPLWHEGQPLWQTVAVGTFAGLLMATTVAVVTGLGLVRLLRRNDVRPPPSLDGPPSSTRPFPRWRSGGRADRPRDGAQGTVAALPGMR